MGDKRIGQRLSYRAEDDAYDRLSVLNLSGPYSQLTVGL
jgi:hypothetical protein